MCTYLLHDHEELHRHHALLVLAAVREHVVARHKPRLKLPLDHLPEHLEGARALAGVAQCVHQGAVADGRDKAEGVARRDPHHTRDGQQLA